MQSIVFESYGSPEVLQVAEIEDPTPADDEVLVRIHAASLNSWDWDVLRGEFTNRLMFGLLKPKIKTLGADIAGRVEAVGRRVTHFAPGDEVWGDLCGNGWGGFAEYVCAKESFLALKPANLSFTQAAALPQAGLLALQALCDIGNIQSRQTVLINGAGGGVGVFAVQIAKSFGAQVTAVDREDKLHMLRRIGADHVIDYDQDDFTQGGRYDLILDVNTSRSIVDYVRALNPGGIYVTVGDSLGRLFQILILGPWVGRPSGKRLRVLAYRPNKGLAHLKELAESGKLRPVIDGPYPLQGVRDAFHRFAASKHQGKIVFSIG